MRRSYKPPVPGKFELRGPGGQVEGLGLVIKHRLVCCSRSLKLVVMETTQSGFFFSLLF